jgi:glycosyltransferase involved in cell wall biosynthesis
VEDGMTASVSCIIPAWNEASRIGAVLHATIGHPGLSEVIVVDDASSDTSADVAEAAGARVFRQPRNAGKSAAIARGLAEATGSHILFLDADLVGLTAAHVSSLLTPVLSGRADVTISLRDNAPWPWRMIGLDYISGERVMARALLHQHLDRIAALRRFGLEVFLNDLWIEQGLRLEVVPLSIRSPLKTEKHGMLKGISGDLGMIGDIFRTVGPHRALAQIVAMRAMARSALKNQGSLRVPEGV